MAKKSDAWMPFYVGDYLSATSRLTTEQHGAYLLILLDYWKNGPPPNDDIVLAQIARVAPAAWRKIKPALIGFFDVKAGTLVQKRVEKELKRASEITDERSKAGKIGAEKRWQNRKQNDGNQIANATREPMANAKQNDAQPQPPRKEEKTLPPDSTNLRATDCFNEICLAAGWSARTDEQRITGLSIIDGWLALGCRLELILDGIARARKRDPSPTKSLKRFDTTIRGMRSDELGGELPVSGADVKRTIEGVAGRLAVQ